MYSRFNLVLMVNHACNLRCSYCYTGAKFSRAMTERVGIAAIDRAVNSLFRGGTLELGFFGGEPLLEPHLIRSFLEKAKTSAEAAGLSLQLTMTTNGTMAEGVAWELLILPGLDLAISHDGLPQVHDKHRYAQGVGGTSALVETTMKRLIATGKDFRVVMVVRPDTLQWLHEGIEYLGSIGVRRFEPSLDLWTNWTREDGPKLEEAISRCAAIWRNALPNIEISWFDEMAVKIGQVPSIETARCGFGDGQIAVAPSGNLYPCERLIGEDAAHSPMRLNGHGLEGNHFLGLRSGEQRAAAECLSCAMQSLCGTTCRCSNYIRTGKVEQPDGLLCLVEQLCMRETLRVFGSDRDLVTLRI